VFFYLARHRVSDEHHALIFPNYKRRKPGEEARPLPTPLPAFIWEDRAALIHPLLQEPGEITAVKVSLMGRPGKIEERKDLVIVAMSHAIKSPTLPKGVPTPPADPTIYTIYVASKQWKRVEEAITDPEDALIVEGTAAFDPEINGIAVFAMNVTTKLLEGKRRQQQKEAATQTTETVAPRPPVQSKPVKSRIAEVPIAHPAQPVVHNDHSGMPLKVAQKLNELYASASVYRQKIANLESKPANQQFGMDMTRKLLKNVEEEINSLEKKYAAK
jgi:hypothetical protein